MMMVTVMMAMIAVVTVLAGRIALIVVIVIMHAEKLWEAVDCD
jgi:hypothetical protein